MSDLTVGECESESVIGYISNHAMLIIYAFNCYLFYFFNLSMSSSIHFFMLSTIVTFLLPYSHLNTLLLAGFFTSRYYPLFS